jgi:hypothetical protein
MEQQALDRLVDQPGTILRWELPKKLTRLLRPLDEVMEYISPAFRRNPARYNLLRRFLCLEMQQRRTAFWAWSQQEWLQVLRTRRDPSAREVRAFIPAVAYLANPALDVIALATTARIQLVQVAQKARRSWPLRCRP